MKDKRILLNDRQRIRLAARAKQLTRELLEATTVLFTPDTILILFSEEQLRYVLTEHLKHYHHKRIHQGIITPDSRGDMPSALPSQPSSFSPVLRLTARNVISYAPINIWLIRFLRTLPIGGRRDGDASQAAFVPTNPLAGVGGIGNGRRYGRSGRVGEFDAFEPPA